MRIPKMRKIIAGLTPFLVIFHVACGGGGGGGGGGKPPKVAQNGMPSNPADAESEAALQHGIQVALQACTPALGQFAQAAGPALCNPQFGNMPVDQALQQASTLNPAIQSQFVGPQTPPQKACSDAISNVLGNLTTMGNGQYVQRPDVQNYIREAFIFPLGNAVAQSLPPQAIADPTCQQRLLQGGGLFFSQRVTPFVGQQFQGLISSNVGPQLPGFGH